MIAPQAFETYDIFGSGATKVEPPAAKRSAGWQQADVLPAEYMNWAWYKNSKCITDLNSGVKSVEDEIKTVLDNANISPDASAINQLFTAIQKNTGCIITDALTPTTITNAPALQTGSVVKIMFGADVTGANTSTALTISYNGSGKTVKVCKNGSLADVTAHEITSGTFKYIQSHTTIEFVYDGTYFVIVGNPVVLSGADYTIYADGKKVVNTITPGDMNAVTSNAVANNKIDTVTSSSQLPVTSHAVAVALDKMFADANIDNTKFALSTNQNTQVTASYSGILYVNFQFLGTATTAIFEDGNRMSATDMYTPNCYLNNFTILIRRGHKYHWVGSAQLWEQQFLPFAI